MATDIDNVAKQFTDFYYATFDSGRGQLFPLYRETSMLSWEGSKLQGATSIVEKLAGLPFQTVLHKVTTIDAQPSSAAGAIIVSVTGLLVVDGSSTPLNFSQVFQLIPDGGSYYISNDVFRLNYG